MYKTEAYTRANGDMQNATQLKQQMCQHVAQEISLLMFFFAVQMWYFLRVAFNTCINCSFVQLYLPILLLPFLYFIQSRSRLLRVNL